MLGDPSTAWTKLGELLAATVAVAALIAWPIGARFAAKRPAAILHTE